MTVRTRIERLERGRMRDRSTRQKWHKCDALDEAYCEATGEVVTGQELDQIRRTVGELWDLPSLHLWPFGDGTNCQPDRLAWWRRRMVQRREHLDGWGGVPRHMAFDVEGCPDCAQATRRRHDGGWEFPPDDWTGWEKGGEALRARLDRALDWELAVLADKVRAGERVMPEVVEGDELSRGIREDLERRLGGDHSGR